MPGQSCGITQGDQVFNPNAFTLVGYQIGTIPSNIEPRGYCRGPGLLDTDLSIDKNFKLTERVRMQFRMDFFNIFNHANFRGDQIKAPASRWDDLLERELRSAAGKWPVRTVQSDQQRNWRTTGVNWFWPGDIGGRKRRQRNSVRVAHHFLIGCL